MNRRSFISGLGAAGFASAVLPQALGAELPASSAQNTAAPDASSVVRDSPAVYAPTPEGATIVWPVREYCAGWVEHGESGSSAPGRIARADGFGFVPHSSRVLRVRLSGLKPGQSYWFRTHTRPVYTTRTPPADLRITTSRIYTLRVLDPAASEAKFCVWNDTHDRANTLARLGELTRAEPADFLLWNGDVTNDLHTEESIAGLFLQPKGDVNLADGPPILLTRGNHDVRGHAANRVPEYVSFPGDRPYFSFRVGPVAAIALDTGEDKPDNHPSFLGLADFEPLIHDQAQWLAREIEKPEFKSAPYKLVFCHIPLRWKNEFTPTYDDAGRSYDHWSARGRAAWHDSLVRWGAQMVLSGHTHQWHHLPATAEFPYAQLVGGGPALDETDAQAVLIRAHATARALTFRLINASANKQVFETAIGPAA